MIKVYPYRKEPKVKGNMKLERYPGRQHEQVKGDPAQKQKGVRPFNGIQNKKLNEYTKEELLELVNILRKRKKYGLLWEAKLEDVVEQCRRELPVLEEVKDLAIGTVRNQPTNLIIEGDNYHALSVLNYTHAGKVDVIYIDPPYNTGAKDWKYNNDYVDVNDTFRHSKWLSMMHSRLVLAKNLLTKNGVVIVTIDEHEVHHLGLLLEEVYPESYRQMVSIVINPKGVTQDRFSRVDEYAIFCFFGASNVQSIGDDLLTPLTDDEEATLKPRWKGLLRSGTNARREDRKNLFYPVLVDPKRLAVVGTGEPLPYEQQPDLKKKIKGLVAAWPVRKDGSLGNWGVGHTTLRKLIDKGYVNLGAYDEKRQTWGISYLGRTAQEQIEGGTLQIVSFDKTKNVVDVEYTSAASRRVKSIWHRTSHDAGAYGADYLRKILGERAFQFPKSIYAVKDCLEVLVKNKPEAVVLDFFAGSGTTGHAVLELNKRDKGARQFILVTNDENEIASRVTYPRIRRVIEGVESLPEISGYEANVRYFKTAFVTKDVVSDNTRRALVARSTDMICVREGAYEKRVDNKQYKIYTNSKIATGILFDLDAIDDFKKKIASLHLPAHLYVFSLTSDTFAADFKDLEVKHRLCPIPESILEVYRRLFLVS